MDKSDNSLLAVHNGQAFEAGRCPLVDVERFRRTVLEQVAAGARIASLFGRPAGDGFRMTCVLARDAGGDLALLSADVEDSYPSLTPDCPQAHWFERELREQWGVMPAGHPWLKPIRFSPPRKVGTGPTFPPQKNGACPHFSPAGWT